MAKIAISQYCDKFLPLLHCEVTCTLYSVQSVIIFKNITKIKYFDNPKARPPVPLNFKWLNIVLHFYIINYNLQQQYVYICFHWLKKWRNLSVIYHLPWDKESRMMLWSRKIRLHQFLQKKSMENMVSNDFLCENIYLSYSKGSVRAWL